jgi:hypothetical protein
LACSLPAFAQTSGTTDVIPIGGKWNPMFGNQPLDSLQAACEFDFNALYKNRRRIPDCRIVRLSSKKLYESYDVNVGDYVGLGHCFVEAPIVEYKTINNQVIGVCTDFIEEPSLMSVVQHAPPTCPAPANGQRAAAATDCECPVKPLKPITDPEALRFENGDNVREDKLSPSMKTKLQCLKNAGVGFKLTSAWRPQSYQDHLYEIYTKLIKFDKLAENKQLPMVCNSLRTSIDKHAGDHGVANMLPSGKRKSVAILSNHRLGNAFDGKWSASDAKLDAAAKACGLWRPLKFNNDPPHFESL